MLDRRPLACFLSCWALAAAAGCSGAEPSTGPTGALADAGADSADAKPATVGGGHGYVFHVRATTAPFPHEDGLAGQTATEVKQGIRSLRLLRDASDPSPIVVFDHGNGYVEAGYDDGDDSVVARAAAASLPGGRFTLARIAVTHSRFRVASTLHVAGGAYPGVFDCVQALSDDVVLNGGNRARGWYRYVFEVAGKSYPIEGADAPLPTSPTTGGFTLKTEGSESFYEVALDMLVDPAIDHDVHVDMTVNMHESFRWEDQTQPGYATGVYDTTPSSYEPIRRFGANAFVVSLR